MHVGDDVLAVDLEGGSLGQAQRRVEDGPVLGHVDVGAGEHRVATSLDTDLVGQGEQGGEHVVVEEGLREVDVEVGRGEREPLDPIGVRGEPGAQIRLEALGQDREPRPGLRRGRIDGGFAHCAPS